MELFRMSVPLDSRQYSHKGKPIIYKKEFHIFSYNQPTRNEWIDTIKKDCEDKEECKQVLNTLEFVEIPIMTWDQDGYGERIEIGGKWKFFSIKRINYHVKN